MCMKRKKELKISILLDENSMSDTCKNLVNEVICDLKTYTDKYQSIDYEISYLVNKEQQILFCRNCKKCFEIGTCILDKLDGVDIIRNLIYESQLFIIATPVYEKNVSAFIKSFLDRFGYWCHLMPMLGKKCIIIVSAKYTGYDYVCRYLYEICSQFGFNVLGVICKNSTKRISILKEEILFISENIAFNILLNEVECSNTYLEEIYINYKKIFLSGMESDKKNYEFLFWEKSALIDTYQEFINNESNNKYDS